MILSTHATMGLKSGAVVEVETHHVKGEGRLTIYNGATSASVLLKEDECHALKVLMDRLYRDC